MGLTYADITLTNGEDIILCRNGYMDKDEIKTINVRALVDTGAVFMVINEDVQGYLNLPIVRKQTFSLGDSTQKEFDVVSPLQITFKNRTCSVEAVIAPADSTLLLGAIPLEYMDVLIDPVKQTLVLNSETSVMDLNVFLPPK